MNLEQLQTEFDAFLNHQPQRTPHRRGEQAAINTDALATVAGVASGAVFSGGLPDPTKLPEYAAYVNRGTQLERENGEVNEYLDQLEEPLEVLLASSRRYDASMPFELRFGHQATNEWVFSDRTAPYLAIALRQRLDVYDVDHVLETGLDAAAFSRDHELMVAVRSGGGIPWIPAIAPVLHDALNVANPSQLESFIVGLRVIESSWPAVSERIALSRVLGPTLNHVREGKRLLELQLPDDARAVIERASGGFGNTTPGPAYYDADFIFGGFDDWCAASEECGETVDAGPRAIRSERARLVELLPDDARLLPLYSLLEVGGGTAWRHVPVLLHLRLLHVHAEVRWELLAGRTLPEDLGSLVADMPERWDSAVSLSDGVLTIESEESGGPHVAPEAGTVLQTVVVDGLEG